MEFETELFDGLYDKKLTALVVIERTNTIRYFIILLMLVSVLTFGVLKQYLKKNMKKLKVFMMVALLGAMSFGAFTAYEHFTKSEKESLLLTNCNQIKVEGIENCDNIFIDSIADVKYIQLLKPSSQNYIGNIKKIISLKYIYISDGENIFTYDMDGQCKSVFNKLGKAGDEYLELSDFDVIDNLFYIIDRNLRKILIYNMKGECLSSYELDFYPKSIKMIDNTSMIICAENDIIKDEEKMKFHIYDINKKITNSFYPIDIHKGKYLKYLWNSNFTVVNDSIFYYEPNDNTILHITKENYTPYIKLDFGKHEAPAEFYNKDYENVAYFFYDFHEKQYASGVYWAIWNNSKILFQFIHDKELKVGLINRLDNNTSISKGIYSANYTKLEEVYISGENIISYIYPEKINNDNLNSDIILLIAKLKL